MSHTANDFIPEPRYTVFTFEGDFPFAGLKDRGQNDKEILDLRPIHELSKLAVGMSTRLLLLPSCYVRRVR